MKLKDLIQALQEAVKQGVVDEEWPVLGEDCTDNMRPNNVQIEKRTIAGRHYANVILTN